MRFKYYLRGIGFGIIFASLIFTVALATSDKEEITDQEIMERASELGMVSAESKVMDDGKDEITSEITSESDKKEQNKADTQKTDKKESDEEDLSKSDEEDSKTDIVEAKENDSQKKDDSSKVKDDSKEKDTEKPVNNSEKKDYVVINVKTGMVCRDIAELLQKEGVIEDSEEFRIYMGQKGYANKIKCGTFEIPVNANFEQIVKCLIK